MKRKEMLKRINRAARARNVEWVLAREGGNHSVFLLGSTKIPVPRHSEIDERLAVTIFKQAEGELGKNWWQ